MKTLKPNGQTSSTIVPNDYFSDMNNRLNDIENALSNTNEEINEINQTLDSNSITKESIHSVNIENDNSITTTSITSDVADIETADISSITSDIIESTVANIGSLSGTNVNVNKVTSDEATITSLSSTTMESTNGAFGEINADEINATDSSITNLDVTNLSASSFSTPSLEAMTLVESSQVDTDLLNATAIDVTNAEIDEADIDGAEITTLKNSVKAFSDDAWIEVSTENEDPFYIELPTLNNGSYRLHLEDSNGVMQFEVLFTNAYDSPLMQYYKANDNALQKVFYKDGKLVLQSYLLNGKLYWSSDDVDANLSPSTYTENPMPNGYEYLCSASKRVVVLGNGSAYYGLDIKGKLSADIFVDTSREGTPLFYSGDSAGLISQLNSYLEVGESISVSGYMKDETVGEESTYSIQTITRNNTNEYWAYIECKNGVGTDKIQITSDMNARFGVFTTTPSWDANING